MLFVADIGNTNIVLGIFQQEKLVKKWRLSTHRNNTRDEYSIFLNSLLRENDITADDITAASLCSVVPMITPRFEEIIQKDFGVEPVVVRPGIKTGLQILYEPPHEVGADRVVNSVAGFRKYGGPLIIVDFGTATTFDVITAGGEYIGGVITPGPRISAEALSVKAAQLPRVDMLKPREVIGKNTTDAMRSGLYYAHPGACDRIIEKISESFDDRPTVIATGGLADSVKEESIYIEKIEHDLTLIGLKMIYEINTND